MKVYKQSTDYTYGVASLMTAVHFFKPEFKLNRINEFKIWQESVVLPTTWVSIYSLGRIAVENGLNVKVIVGEPDYKFPNYRFRGYKKKEVEMAEFSSKLHYKKAIKAGVEIEEKEFTLSDVKRWLKNGKFLLLRIDTGTLKHYRHELKYVLVIGYQNKRFTIIDSVEGEKEIEEELMKKSFEDITTKDRRDHRVIVIS